MVEVTLRCFEGQMLLAPNPELEQRILGVLGRALHLFPVLLHAFQFMSNHLHMLMTVADAQRLASFMAYFAKQTGDAVREARGCRQVWQARYWHQCIFTDEEATRRLRYILSNGVKEGLVERPDEWPGLTAARALCAQTDIDVRWSTSAERRAARRAGTDAVGIPYSIRLEPLPAWRRHSPIVLRAMFAAMCRDIELQYRAERKGRSVLGPDALRRVDPRATRELPMREPRTGELESHARRVWKNVLAEVTDAYHAARRLRGIVATAMLPPGCFAGPGCFVPWSETAAAAIESRLRGIQRAAEPDFLVR